MLVYTLLGIFGALAIVSIVVLALCLSDPFFRRQIKDSLLSWQKSRAVRKYQSNKNKKRRF